MGDKSTLYKVKQSNVKVTKPYDREAAHAAAKQAADQRGGLGPDEDILPLPKGSDPPGGGFHKIPSPNPDFDIYYRKRGSGGTGGTGAGSGPGQQGQAEGAPSDGGEPGSNGTSPNSTPGAKEADDVEKNFSGDKDPDGVCVKCIARGAAKGGAIASVIGLVLTILSLFLPEIWLARIAGVLLGLGIAALIKLAKNWGKMSSHERQEAGAEVVVGTVVGFGGGRLTPGPGSPGPEGAPEAVTPEGVPAPVPEAGPEADRPMEMGRADNPGGKNRREDFDRGPGGGRKHESHGTGSDDSAAGQQRKAERQEKFRDRRLSEKQAEQQARADLEELRQKLGDNNLKTFLGKQTEQQWIRERQLKLLGRKDK
jgi:hypothetical protein